MGGEIVKHWPILKQTIPSTMNCHCFDNATEERGGESLAEINLLNSTTSNLLFK